MERCNEDIRTATPWDTERRGKLDGCIEDACQDSVCQDHKIDCQENTCQECEAERQEDARRVNWNRCEVEEECQEFEVRCQ